MGWATCGPRAFLVRPTSPPPGKNKMKKYHLYLLIPQAPLMNFFFFFYNEILQWMSPRDVSCPVSCFRFFFFFFLARGGKNWVAHHCSIWNSIVWPQQYTRAVHYSCRAQEVSIIYGHVAKCTQLWPLSFYRWWVCGQGNKIFIIPITTLSMWQRELLMHARRHISSSKWQKNSIVMIVCFLKVVPKYTLLHFTQACMEDTLFCHSQNIHYDSIWRAVFIKILGIYILI